MNSDLFLPKEIKVGYQERGSTYTGKLAYVIYIDEKGKVRKEKSFDSWRNHDLGVNQYDNTPTEGFVLNKKAGGYSTGWNHRQTYVRVYDPRGFEIEVSVQNLLHILDNTSSIIGKGLEGEFVYAWQGTELILLPVSSPDYEGLKQLNDLRHKQDYIKAKDLIIGATYLTKKNEKRVYLGKYDEFEHHWKTHETTKKNKKQFYFSTLIKSGYDSDYYFETFASVSQKLIDTIDKNPHPDLAGIFESLEGRSRYSPVDLSKTEEVYYSLDEFLSAANESRWSITVMADNGKKYRVSKSDNSFSGDEEVEIQVNPRNYWVRKTSQNVYEGKIHEVASLEDIFNVLKPKVRNIYLTSGKLYKSEGKID